MSEAPKKRGRKPKIVVEPPKVEPPTVLRPSSPVDGVLLVDEIRLLKEQITSLKGQIKQLIPSDLLDNLKKLRKDVREKEKILYN